ncbi:MAG: hypothetical protein ACP5T9_05310 [Thermoplasmata archaeon]
MKKMDMKKGLKEREKVVKIEVIGGVVWPKKIPKGVKLIITDIDEDRTFVVNGKFP